MLGWARFQSLLIGLRHVLDYKSEGYIRILQMWTILLTIMHALSRIDNNLIYRPLRQIIPESIMDLPNGTIPIHEDLENIPPNLWDEISEAFEAALAMDEEEFVQVINAPTPNELELVDEDMEDSQWWDEHPAPETVVYPIELSAPASPTPSIPDILTSTEHF